MTCKKKSFDESFAVVQLSFLLIQIKMKDLCYCRKKEG